MAKISVIIPIFNVEDYLEECLGSVLNQTLEDIEIICINDGSTDGSLEILNSMSDERITIIDQENRGLSAARNVGIKHATGEYICFVDSDDYLEPTALEQTYAIAKDKSLDMLIFKLLNFDDKTHETHTTNYYEMKKLKSKVNDSVFSHEDITKLLFYLSVTAPAKLFKSSIIKDIEFPEGLIFEDNPFFLEAMFKSKRVCFYDKHLYYRRIRHDSIIQTSSKRNSDWLEITNIIIGISKKYGQYEKYRNYVYHSKFINTVKFLGLTDEAHKEEFFERMKEDFIRLKEEVKDDEVYERIYKRYKVIHRLGIDCESCREFEYKANEYILNVSNKILKKKSRKLQREIEDYKKSNDLILNSTSWKITAPLRKVSNGLRRVAK